MSNVPARSESGGLRAMVERPEVRTRIAEAVGDVMDAGTFVAHMMVAFQEPAIKGCTDLSKFTALHECAALALLPTLNQVKLIPYKDQLKAMPQWQGYKALMERNPAICEVQGVLVHTADRFAFVNGEVAHEYNPFDPNRSIEKMADLLGGYVKITYTDGRLPKYHIVTVKTITKARACAQTQKVWDAWFEQMALKTLYRDCYARRAVPIDPFVQARMQKAVDADDAFLGNDPRRVEIPDDGRTRTERLTERLTAPPEPAPDPEPAPEYVEPDPEPTDDEPEPPADEPADADVAELKDRIIATYQQQCDAAQIVCGPRQLTKRLTVLKTAVHKTVSDLEPDGPEIHEIMLDLLNQGRVTLETGEVPARQPGDED